MRKYRLICAHQDISVHGRNFKGCSMVGTQDRAYVKKELNVFIKFRSKQRYPQACQILISILILNWSNNERLILFGPTVYRPALCSVLINW